MLQVDLLVYIDRERDSIDIRESINTSKDLTEIPFLNEFLPLKLGEKVVFNSEADVENIFPIEIVEAFENNYCGAILVPIFVEDIELKLLGVIGILAIEDKILGDEENIITLESIASHIAPVLYQFDTLRQVIKQYKPDYQVLFLNDLKQDVIEAEDFYLELKIVHICINERFTFARVKLDDLKENLKKYTLWII